MADNPRGPAAGPLPREVRFALAFQKLVATIYDEYGEVTERVGAALQHMVKEGTSDA